MYSLSKRSDFNTICAFVRFYKITRKSHYDILNLPKNCSDKEIKNAFIQLSKKFHPDKNKDAKAQAHFVKIVEAYNVLGKPSSRAQYDNTYYGIEVNPSTPYVYKRNNSAKKHSYNSDPFGFPKERHFGDQNNNPYYGIKNIKKLPNYVIVLICFGIAVIGTIVQVIVIRGSYARHSRRAQEKSRQAGEALEKVREAAKANSNEVQTQLILDRIVTAANPTVATASLGHALASEEK